MTIVVVDPVDIREDSEQALRGLEILRGDLFAKQVIKLYESVANQTFNWFGLRASKPIYTRRQIAKWFDEIVNDLPRSKDNAIRDWNVTDWAAWQMYDFKLYHAKPVRTLITAAQSLNALELHVESRTLCLFEEAYDAGERQYAAEE